MFRNYICSMRRQILNHEIKFQQQIVFHFCNWQMLSEFLFKKFIFDMWTKNRLRIFRSYMIWKKKTNLWLKSSKRSMSKTKCQYLKNVAKWFQNDDIIERCFLWMFNVKTIFDLKNSILKSIKQITWNDRISW